MADPRRVAAAVVRRPVTQAVAGVVAGCTLLMTLQQTVSTDGLSAPVVQMVLGSGAVLFVIWVLACMAPIQRALRVDSTEAQRADR